MGNNAEAGWWLFLGFVLIAVAVVLVKQNGPIDRAVDGLKKRYRIVHGVIVRIK